MRNQWNLAPMTLCSGLLLVSLVASAQTTVNQVLDSTFIHGRDKAAELLYVDDSQTQYDYLGISGTALEACKLTAFHGLFCLDAKAVRNWPNPSTQVNDNSTTTVASHTVVNCADNKLDLDDNKANTCTGMTVDFDGNIWLAGKTKGKSHSLIKLVAKNPDCPSVEPGTFLGSPDSNLSLCAYEVATGRPLLVDLAPVDGALAKQFSLPGHDAPLRAILGLEERKTAVAFLDGGIVYEMAGGKSDWGLIGNEQLLTITLLQLKDPVKNYILVTTSKGRVLAWDTDGGAIAKNVFDISTREQTTFDQGPCSSEDPFFSVRASSTTNLVYVTDSEYCEVSALEAQRHADGTLDSLVRAYSEYSDPTFFTDDLTAVTGVTVAPGNFIDLSKCAGTNEPCPMAVDESGNTTASLAGVKLVDTSISGLTLFQVDGMPDCRYVPLDCLAIINPGSELTTTPEDAVSQLIGSVIVPLELATGDDRDVLSNPGAQRLNITPLLPEEITELFPLGLPDMLLPHYVRGQKSNGFIFGGFFGVTQDGVMFRDTFEGHYDVAALAGSSLGCADNLGTLDWDIAGTVSERWESAQDDYLTSATTNADDPPKPFHLMSIVNSGCGSSRTSDPNFSFKPYNLEPTPCTFNPDLTDVWWDDGACAMAGGPAEEPDDAVYAKMLLVLADDFDRMLGQLACVDADGNGVAPLDTAACQQIQGQVDNMIDKLYKCWDATQQPKQSSGDQNCQAFDSQLGNVQQLLEQTPVVYPDFANRHGELKARAATMRHVYTTRFLPSLALTPEGQFIED